MVYGVQFIVRDGSVHLHLLIPKYGDLTFMTCKCFLYRNIALTK